jgi:hydrogenase expression/formation protein HypC
LAGDAVTDLHSSAEPGRSVIPVVAGGGASCTDSCITCGDIAVEVPVVRLLPRAMAVVATEAGEEEVSIALVDASIGDTILVHASEAIAVIRR